MFEVRHNIRSQLLDAESNKTVSSYEIGFCTGDRVENLNKRIMDFHIENFNSNNNNSTTNITNNYADCLRQVK